MKKQKYNIGNRVRVITEPYKDTIGTVTGILLQDDYIYHYEYRVTIGNGDTYIQVEENSLELMEAKVRGRFADICEHARKYAEPDSPSCELKMTKGQFHRVLARAYERGRNSVLHISEELSDLRHDIADVYSKAAKLNHEVTKAEHTKISIDKI